MKSKKLVELMMVSGIPTASGYEERIRFSELEVVDRGANENGLLVNMPEGNNINGWDVNVAGVRTTSVKRTVRYHQHAVMKPWVIEKFLPSQADRIRNSFCASNTPASQKSLWAEGTENLQSFTNAYVQSSRGKCWHRCRERIRVQLQACSVLGVTTMLLLYLRFRRREQLQRMVIHYAVLLV